MFKLFKDEKLKKQFNVNNIAVNKNKEIVNNLFKNIGLSQEAIIKSLLDKDISRDEKYDLLIKYKDKIINLNTLEKNPELLVNREFLHLLNCAVTNKDIEEGYYLKILNVICYNYLIGTKDNEDEEVKKIKTVYKSLSSNLNSKLINLLSAYMDNNSAFNLSLISTGTLDNIKNLREVNRYIVNKFDENFIKNTNTINYIYSLITNNIYDIFTAYIFDGTTYQDNKVNNNMCLLENSIVESLDCLNSESILDLLVTYSKDYINMSNKGNNTVRFSLYNIDANKYNRILYCVNTIASMGYYIP